MFIKNKTTCDHRVGDPVIGYTLENCPRCMGRGWYGGFDFTSDGKIKRASGVNAVKQKIEKILTEKKRPTGYGFDFDLIRTISSTAGNIVKYEIHRCITYLIVSQQQEKQQGVIYNPAEEIMYPSDVSVEFSTINPRSITAYVSVITKSGVSVSTMVDIKR